MAWRWENYFLEPDFQGFWDRRLANDAFSVCVIIGVGFDPRSLDALERIALAGKANQVACMAVHLPAGPTTGDSIAVIEELTAANKKRLSLLGGVRLDADETIRLQDDSGYATGGREILAAMSKHAATLASYRDVVVDISGFPRTVFFPLISYLIKLADNGRLQNLHVAITEDPVLDSRIRGREYGSADYLQTFRLQDRTKTVWLPVISATEGLRLHKIHEMLRNDCLEVCPILPFPALDLRRADDVLIKLRDVLFKVIDVSKENILLCDERAPFDIYRKILQIDDDYQGRLAITPEIGKVTPVLSPLATKTLSLGMLLAAVERKLPVCYVEAGSYALNEGNLTELESKQDRSTTEIWLTGEPYALP